MTHVIRKEESSLPFLRKMRFLRAEGRARLLSDGHIGRVAVLAQWRGRGVGRALMRSLMQEAAARGNAAVIVNAQVQAMPFYARDGFVATGEAFLEAGIAHRVMTRKLR